MNNLPDGTDVVKIKLSDIELDTSIQCRAAIDSAVVNDYAERMGAGDVFPPVELYGTAAKCWIADGWHRIMAARQLGYVEIDADLRPGGRADALKEALGANAVHGHRRSNADKRRCVEIALKEFSKMSDRAIAEMCAVSKMVVNTMRPKVALNATSTRTGLDGKEYTVKPKPEPAAPEPEEPGGDATETDDSETPCANAGNRLPSGRLPRNRMGVRHATEAINALRRIMPDDELRDEAFRMVWSFIKHHWKRGDGKRGGTQR